MGILSGILYGNNIRAILDDVRSVNLGAVYEPVVATELAAHGHRLFYYANRSKGEVDYLIDDYGSLSVANGGQIWAGLYDPQCAEYLCEKRGLPHQAWICAF